MKRIDVSVAKTAVERLALRQSYGLSIPQWAQLMCVHPSTISRWETTPANPDHRARSFFALAEHVPLERRRLLSRELAHAMLFTHPLNPLRLLLREVLG